MSGGIIQLVAYGKEDIFLTHDPQITMFKMMYRRHTNFSREDICQEFLTKPDFGKRSTCVLTPEADLIYRTSIRIKLPTIPKSSKTAHQSLFDDNIEQKVAWVRKLGFAMIKNVEIEIDGEVVDRHYGEWMYIWASLTTRNITDGGLDRLIGDIPELYEFTDGKDSQTIYVPLYFWFCRSPGLALPMVNLQYSDIKINVEFYDIEKCLLITPTNYIYCDCDIDNFVPNEYIFQKLPDGNINYGMFSHYDIVHKRLFYRNLSCELFIGPPVIDNKSNKNKFVTHPSLDKKILKNNQKYPNYTNSTKSHDSYDICGMTSCFSISPCPSSKSFSTPKNSLHNFSLDEAVLLVDYVYLDDSERLKIVKSKHDYLIEQLYFTPNIRLDNSHIRARLNIDQPCKLMVWLAQLDDIAKCSNDRFNYTTSSITYNDKQKHSNINKNTKQNMPIIEKNNILLNSQQRLSERDFNYYEKIQPLQHTRNRLPPGVGMYSFALFPTDIIPSGTTNMSQIELIDMELKLNDIISPYNKGKFRAYSLCYNVWRVNSGVSGTIFIR